MAHKLMINDGISLKNGSELEVILEGISFSVTNEGGTDDPTFRSIKVFMEMKPE